MSYEEALAIRWHGGCGTSNDPSSQGKMMEAYKVSTLALLLHIADMQATCIDEVNVNSTEKVFENKEEDNKKEEKDDENSEDEKEDDGAGKTRAGKTNFGANGRSNGRTAQTRKSFGAIPKAAPKANA